jgi:hypothetical protein
VAAAKVSLSSISIHFGTLKAALLGCFSFLGLFSSWEIKQLDKAVIKSLEAFFEFG